MSTDNIITLAGKFKTQVELQQYCDAQFKTIQEAAKKIKQLEEENAHLKKLVGDAVPLIEEPKIEKIIKTPAEIICELQIKRLEDVALQRGLTLEETKQLDLFIKNLRLLQGDSTTIPGEVRKSKKQISQAELIKIASQPIKVDTDE